jgi:hypothetical protein
MAGGTFAPVPGAAATMEMPTIPVSPAKGGKKGAAASHPGLSPGLAPGMYNLGGGRGAHSVGQAQGGRGAVRLYNLNSVHPRRLKGAWFGDSILKTYKVKTRFQALCFQMQRMHLCRYVLGRATATTPRGGKGSGKKSKD